MAISASFLHAPGDAGRRPSSDDTGPRIGLCDHATTFADELTERIADFLDGIGVRVTPAELGDDTFLPGIRVATEACSSTPVGCSIPVTSSTKPAT